MHTATFQYVMYDAVFPLFDVYFEAWYSLVVVTLIWIRHALSDKSDILYLHDPSCTSPW